MLLKICVNGVLHIISDVISIELMDETSESEGWISILYITSLEFTKNKPEGIERTTRFCYDEVEYMTVKKVRLIES